MRMIDRATNLLVLVDAAGFGYFALFVLYLVVTV